PPGTWRAAARGSGLEAGAPAGSGARPSVRSSASVNRLPFGVTCIVNSRAGSISAILPLSLPFHLARSASVRMGATTTSPETGPSVLLLHANGNPMSGAYRGSIILAEYLL